MMMTMMTHQDLVNFQLAPLLLFLLVLIHNNNAQAQISNDQQTYQNAYNKDYQPRYNPSYTNTQQSQLPSLHEIQTQHQDPNRKLMQNTLGVDDRKAYDSFGRIGGGGGSESQQGYLDYYNDEQNFCPEHWITFRQTCYRFVRSPKRNWLDAKNICRAYNAQLLNVDSIEEHSFILKQLIVQKRRHSRFWVSAFQTGPNSWINDDNSQFPVIEGAITFDREQGIGEEDLHDNRFLVQNENYNKDGSFNDNNQYFNAQSTNRRNNLPGDRRYLEQDLKRERLIYGFSKKNDRWMFMPAYAMELNLFICESKELYSVENVNLRADNERSFDYGIFVRDSKKVPRGPYFIKHPIDVTYDTSKNRVSMNEVLLSCMAGGYPTPSYHWYREIYANDTLYYRTIDPLKEDRYTISGGNLIISDPTQTFDQGAYHCIAENSFGRVRSESANLNFGFIMEFNAKRSPESADMNWGKSIFCDPPQHYPDVNYYWSRDFFPNFVNEDQRVFVSQDGALYFSYIEIADRANYSCTVHSLVSNTGRNGPFFPLRIIPNSKYQSLIFANTFPKVFPEAPIAGMEIRLECVAFGYPVPSYNWTRRGLPLQKNAYMTNYNRVLIIKNSSVEDNGEYICTITNSPKSLQKSIHINVQMKPDFSIPLQDRVKDNNGEVTFVCEALAIPDVKYTWYKNGEKLVPEDMDRDRYTIQDNILSIKYLDPLQHDGMYQCGASNQLKTSFSSCQLRVISMKPSFRKYPLEPDIYAIHNGNATIVCNPEAAPRPKFQWKKDGQLIGSGGHRRILPNGTLMIAPISRDDEGYYTCIATNNEGTSDSSSRLIVLQELRFVQTLPLRITSQIHDLIHLQCEVSYDPILDIAFIWKHNSITLRHNHDGRGRMIINYNRLTVHNVTLLDGGEYECVVKSSVDTISSKTIVVIESVPDPPGGVQVVDVSKTTALIEWVDGNDNGRPILYYNVLGRTNWNRTWTNVTTHLSAHPVDRYTGRQQATVSNLTPWSSYEFSVAAVNDLGIGTASAPSPIYSTHDDRPYIAPRNIGGGGGKIGDLTITWDPLLPQEQNSHGIHYKVFWRLKGNYEWATDIVKRKGKNVGMAVVNIPQNNYYTQYEVKVQSINNVGSGPESDIVEIYSAEDMPQVAPQKPYALAYNSTALNVTWQPIELSREIIRGKLIGHRLKYWKTTHKEEDSVYYLSRTTRNWALIVGLQPDTYYFVKVMAYNAAGEGPESERFEERTYRKAPQKPPLSVHVYGINPSTVRVVWSYISPAQDEEPLKGYKVRVWETDKSMITANDTIVKVGRTLEKYISNLTPGKSYNMRVLAFSNGGDGRMSSPTIRFQMGRSIQNHATRRYTNNLNTALIVVVMVFISRI